MRKKLLSVLTALALCLSLLPTAVFAAETGTAVSYLDASGNVQTCSAYTTVTDTDSGLGADNTESWYVVSGAVRVEDNPLILRGTVHLILCDGAMLDAEEGITAYGDLTVYGQSGGTGRLIAVGKDNDTYSYGIHMRSSSLTVNGGNIFAMGEELNRSEGAISCGIFVEQGSLTVNGGSICAIGGEVSGGSDLAVSDYGNWSSCGISFMTSPSSDDGMTISGGSVTAVGGSSCGLSCGISASNGQINVSGGNVSVGSREDAADGGTALDTSNLTVSGGAITLPAGSVVHTKLEVQNSLTLASLLTPGCYYFAPLAEDQIVSDAGQSAGGPVYVRECTHGEEDGASYSSGNCTRCGAPEADYSWYSASASTYTITTAAQLLGFANLVTEGAASVSDVSVDFSGKTVKLGGNIDLSNLNWRPIGDDGEFAGTFDGCNYQITGLYSYRHSEVDIGLFGCINGGTVKNLTVSGTIVADEDVGGIVGDAENCTLENCHSSVAVTAYDGYVGGIVGDADECTVTGCSNTGAVMGCDDYVGGIVGNADECTVTGCSNTGAIMGCDDDIGGIVGDAEECTVTGCSHSGAVMGYDDDVGGIAGDADECTIESCYNFGAVVACGDSLGGVVGRVYGSTVKNCHNAGTITGYDEDVGGIAGYVSASSDGPASQLLDCSNAGTVTGYDDDIGGVAGYVRSAQVARCGNTGAVTGYDSASTSATEGEYVGGVVGHIQSFSNITNTVEYCYNTGAVSGSESVGGVIGETVIYEAKNGSITVQCCYNTGAVTGSSEFEASCIGGVVGHNYLSAGTEDHDGKITMENCYNTGTVTSNGDEVGGVAGANSCSGKGVLTVQNCYNIGSVSTTAEEPNSIGGVVGYKGITEIGCYFLTGCVEESGGISGEEFAAQATFEGWDFTEIWSMNTTHGRPVLQSNDEETTYTVTYSAGEYGSGTIANATKSRGESITLSSSTFTRTGYTHTGWAVQEGGLPVFAFGDTYTADADVTLYPAWTRDSSSGDNGNNGDDGNNGDNGDDGDNGNNGGSLLPLLPIVTRPGTSDDVFTDVKPGDYFYDAVIWAYDESITGGMTATTFGPEASCTRAQMVTFLWRAAGQPMVRYSLSFFDVGQNEYYTEAVRWAASLGIVGGYGNGLFGSNDPITREQMAVILYRFAGVMGMDTTQGGMAVREFSDYESISDYARAAMQWAVNAGILQGAGGKLMPQSLCTRAQIVTMLYRLLEA